MDHQKPRSTTQSQLIETLLIVGVLVLLLAYFAGWLSWSDVVVSSGITTLYNIVWWTFMVVVVLAAIIIMSLIVWFGPRFWEARKKALKEQRLDLYRLDIDREKLAIDRDKSNLELDSLKADIAAKFAAIQNEQLKTQAEVNRLGFIVEQVTANKQIFTLNLNQPDPISHARLFAPNQHHLIESDSTHEPLPSVVDLLVKSQRALLIAPSGAGKTNLLKWYLSRLGDKRVILIDPHSPNLVLGRNVIGSGLDFEAIKSCMLDIMQDISKGYEAGQIVQDGDMGEANTWLVIDEWRDIYKSIGDLAIEFLEQIVVRSRKRGYKVLLLNQNHTVSSWGLAGDMGLLETCALFTVDHDQIAQTRKAYYGWTKSKLRELSMPGNFDGQLEIPANQLVIEQPKIYNPTEQKLLKTLITLNGSANTTSKNQIFKLSGVSKNTTNIKLLDALREA